MKEISYDRRNEEIEAYRNSIRFCIKDIKNPDSLKNLSHITQNIWQNEKRQEKNHDDPGGKILQRQRMFLCRIKTEHDLLQARK